MVGCVAESIDFEFGKEILWNFLQEPVKDHAAFDAALGVQDKDNLGEVRLVEKFFDDDVAGADVESGVSKVALYEALDYIEQNSGARTVRVNPFD